MKLLPIFVGVNVRIPQPTISTCIISIGLRFYSFLAHLMLVDILNFISIHA